MTEGELENKLQEPASHGFPVVC